MTLVKTTPIKLAALALLTMGTPRQSAMQAGHRPVDLPRAPAAMGPSAPRQPLPMVSDRTGSTVGPFAPHTVAWGMASEPTSGAPDALAMIAGLNARTADEAKPTPTQRFSNLATMRRHYEGETTLGVRYVAPEQRAQYAVSIKDGKLFDANSRPLDVVGACAVMDATGQLYATEECNEWVFHHSSLVGGEPVAYAGDIYAVDGRLQYIDRRSGHYQTTTAQLNQAVRHLEEQGVHSRYVDTGV